MKCLFLLQLLEIYLQNPQNKDATVSAKACASSKKRIAYEKEIEKETFDIGHLIDSCCSRATECFVGGRLCTHRISQDILSVIGFFQRVPFRYRRPIHLFEYRWRGMFSLLQPLPTALELEESRTMQRRIPAVGICMVLSCLGTQLLTA